MATNRLSDRRPLAVADPAVACDAARAALATRTEAEILPAIAALAAERGDDARLWQWTALLHRALDDRQPAIMAFDRAASLAPNDVGIAHGRARTTYEAGHDAVDLYRAALRLAPQDGELLLGLTAATIAAGGAERAECDLAGIAARAPGWVQGQAQLARLRWMMGRGAGFDDGFRQAVAAEPRDAALWQAWLSALAHAEDWTSVLTVAAAAQRAIGDAPFLTLAAAEAWSMRDDPRADVAFDALAAVDDTGVAIRRIRHLLRRGRTGPAAQAIERGMNGAEIAAFVPYAAILWRLTGDARYGWLEGQEGLVGIYDLEDRLPPLERLAAKLRALHRVRAAHLDQSVRGGTQTDGILLASVDPDIQAVRRAIVGTVERHVAALPPRDPRHPTLGARRDRPPRFAGSWSVRLTGEGRHENHVHPAGWISSALYVALPRTVGDEGKLTLGEPQRALGLDLAPVRTIVPKPGRLVLFPSTMWHGTVPFRAGERLTIAFDVAHPLDGS